MLKRQIGTLRVRAEEGYELIYSLIKEKAFQKQRKILVLVNPFGGAGAAPGNWQIAQ